MREVQLQAQEATQQQEVDCDDSSDDYSTAATAGSSSSSSSSSSSAGLQVIPVSRLEDVLAAAFDPPYLLRKRSKL
jgi:hypothetical protein